MLGAVEGVLQHQPRGEVGVDGGMFVLVAQGGEAVGPGGPEAGAGEGPQDPDLPRQQDGEE